MEEQILIRYLRGDLDDELCNSVEEWISASEENRREMETLYCILFVNERVDAMNAMDTEAALQRFKNKTGLKKKSVQHHRRVVLYKRVAVAAALFLLLLTSGVFATLTMLEHSSQPMMVTTRLGERAHVTLPDGSQVWLNACSSLEYRKSFFSPRRKTVLNGEAYFDVAHNSRFPFVVSNEHMEITVLGTKFNVRCNADEEQITTSLMEGSVRYRDQNNGREIIMNPSERLVVDKQTDWFRVDENSLVEEATAWIDGRLIFENSSLEEIAGSLEKHYNVHISFADDRVKKLRFNAEFDMTDNIFQILSILQMTNKFTHTIDQRDVVIMSR